MGPKVGLYFWVRVVVMFCVLIAILSIMRKLQNPNSLAQAAGGSKQSISLCPTRVASLSVIGRFALKQDGISWYKMGEGERVELDPDAVEKWFAAYCSIDAEALASVTGTTPLLTFAYVSGTPKTLQMNPDGQFTFDGLNFRSPQLAQALSALETLPVRRAPGQK